MSTNKTTTEEVKVLLGLICFSVLGKEESLDGKKEFVSQNAERLYALSKHHDLAHLFAYAVSKLGISVDNGELSKKIQKQMLVSVLRHEGQSRELQSLMDVLEQNEIWHMPLKGSVIRALYPEPWMRTSCDIDILIKKEDLERAQEILVGKERYTEKEQSGHDKAYVSPTGVMVELHFSLMEDGRLNDADDVLDGVWDSAKKCEGYNFRHEMPDEMFYFYHIAHMAKHFKKGGCGIKPLIDHWMLNNRVSADVQKRKELLIKGGLLAFEEQITNLCKVWFDKEPHTDLTKEMEEYILCGGVYGSLDNSTALISRQRGGRLGHIISMIWLPYESLCGIYPVVGKHRWMTPFCQFRRWIGIIFGGKLSRSVKIIKTVKGKSGEEADRTFEMLEKLGFDI